MRYAACAVRGPFELQRHVLGRGGVGERCYKQHERRTVCCSSASAARYAVGAVGKWEVSLEACFGRWRDGWVCGTICGRRTSEMSRAADIVNVLACAVGGAVGGSGGSFGAGDF